jgi:hypothetical protein
MALAMPFVLFQSCGRDTTPGLIPESDLTPPLVLSAAPGGGKSFSLVFSEDIRVIDNSYFLEPGPKKGKASVEGARLDLLFEEAFVPGEEYRVAGEVEDAKGNSTRFVFAFTGWNDHPASMLLSEVQTGKNSSKTSPHRDFIEFLVLGSGNLGGMELSWSSSVKRCEYSFPGVEVAAGEYLVLHLAPEGIPGEKDEKGEDLALSSGIDSSPVARDFWCPAGALPDENGAIRLKERAGGTVVDLLFYAALDKSGAMKADKLSAFLGEGSGRWILSEPPVWEEAFRWKASTARSLARKPSIEGGTDTVEGKGAWYLGDSGSQSPGSPNIPADPSGGGKKSRGSRG